MMGCSLNIINSTDGITNTRVPDNHVSINAIVVTYNVLPQESQTLQSLKGSSFNKIVICDNSDRPVPFPQEFSTGCFVYISMQGNKGLSNAYARGLEECESIDYVALFDDDTVVPPYYADQMRHVASKYLADVFLPVVYCNSMIVSPCACKGYSFSPVSSLEKIAGDYSAINSGMCVRVSFYDQNPYNERLFLDYVDHDFMRRAQRNRASIYVVKDIVLDQNLSLYLPQPKASAIARNILFEKDCREFYSDTFPRRIYSAWLIFKRRMLLALRRENAGKNHSPISEEL